MTAPKGRTYDCTVRGGGFVAERSCPQGRSTYGFEPGEDGQMGTKWHKPEDVVAKLRQVDVLVSQGQSVVEAIRAVGVTEVTYGTSF